MADRDFYDILGVSRDAPADEIKSAYRKLARKYHPDVNKSDDAGARFREATEAYEALSDPEKRKLYDQFGRAGLQGGFAGAGAPGGRPGGPGSGGRTYHWSGAPGGGNVRFEEMFGQDSPFMHMGLEELLGALGGMGGGRSRTARGRGPGVGRRPPQKGPDAQSDITIEFLQAVRGTTVSMKLRKPDGQEETVQVRIPAGIKDGAKVRVRGKGGTGPAGPGDLYLRVHVRPHEYFRRDGNDIYLELPVSLAEATLGAKVDVPTLEGMTTLTIPPGSSSSRTLRLRGKGVPRKDGHGDMYVTLKIDPPAELSDEAKDLLRKFDEATSHDPRRDVPWNR